MDALAVEDPDGTDVESVTVPVVEVPPAMADWVSVPVHTTLWSVACHFESGPVHITLGAVVSTLVVTVAVLVLPTKSVAVSV